MAAVRLNRVVIVSALLLMLLSVAGAGGTNAAAALRAPTEPRDVRKVEVAPGVEINLAWIPPGVFTMGSPETEQDRDKDEGPRRQVRISKGFWMMTTEVRQGQWQAVMGSNPSHFKDGPDYPVENVSWYDAVEFANQLTEAAAAKNARLGLKPYYTIDVRKRDDQGGIEDAEVRVNPGNKGFRLPTEAEWEYACRAGTATAFHFGETVSTDQANYNGNYTYGRGVEGQYRMRTTPCGSFGEQGKNAWGLHDMHGNVCELCWDWHDENFYQQGGWPTNAEGERVDPTGPQAGSHRVLRGGSWFGIPRDLRSADRLRIRPDDHRSNVGFRLCLDSE